MFGRVVILEAQDMWKFSDIYPTRGCACAEFQS